MTITVRARMRLRRIKSEFPANLNGGALVTERATAPRDQFVSLDSTAAACTRAATPPRRGRHLGAKARPQSRTYRERRAHYLESASDIPSRFGPQSTRRSPLR